MGWATGRSEFDSWDGEKFIFVSLTSWNPPSLLSNAYRSLKLTLYIQKEYMELFLQVVMACCLIKQKCCKVERDNEGRAGVIHHH